MALATAIAAFVAALDDDERRAFVTALNAAPPPGGRPGDPATPGASSSPSTPSTSSPSTSSRVARPGDPDYTGAPVVDAPGNATSAIPTGVYVDAPAPPTDPGRRIPRPGDPDWIEAPPRPAAPAPAPGVQRPSTTRAELADRLRSELSALGTSRTDAIKRASIEATLDLVTTGTDDELRAFVLEISEGDADFRPDDAPRGPRPGDPEPPTSSASTSSTDAPASRSSTDAPASTGPTDAPADAPEGKGRGKGKATARDAVGA